MAGKPEQEPSIEEILASIRQIISDDDEPREADVDLSAKPEEKFVIPTAQPESPGKHDIDDDDILELTNEIPDAREAIDIGFGDEEKFVIPVADHQEDEDLRDAPDLSRQDEEPAAPFFGRDEDLKQNDERDAFEDTSPAESIFTSAAAEATTSAFSKLMGNIPVEREDNRVMYADGRITLEDIAKDLLRPILRDWIDQNLPRIVERLVEKELEKLARQARDD